MEKVTLGTFLVQNDAGAWSSWLRQDHISTFSVWTAGPDIEGNAPQARMLSEIALVRLPLLVIQS